MLAVVQAFKAPILPRVELDPLYLPMDGQSAVFPRWVNPRDCEVWMSNHHEHPISMAKGQMR